MDSALPCLREAVAGNGVVLRIQLNADILAAEDVAASSVEPEPANGSSTSPLAGVKAAINGVRTVTHGSRFPLQWSYGRAALKVVSFQGESLPHQAAVLVERLNLSANSPAKS